MRKEEEEDVGREPESSGDEVPVQKVEVKRQEQKVVAGKGKRGGKMRAPGRGVFEKGRALKGEGKENIEGDGEEEEEIRFGMGSTPKKRGAKTFGNGKVGYGSKGGVGSQGTKRKGDDEGGIYWGMGSTPPKKMRTVNVHAAKGGKTFGKKGEFTYTRAMVHEVEANPAQSTPPHNPRSPKNPTSPTSLPSTPPSAKTTPSAPSSTPTTLTVTFPPTTSPLPPKHHRPFPLQP